VEIQSGIYTRHWHGWHETQTHRTGALWLFCGVRPAHTLKVSSLWMMLNYLVWWVNILSYNNNYPYAVTSVDGLILRVAVLPVDYSISLRELTVHEILSIYLSIHLPIYLSQRHLGASIVTPLPPCLLECLYLCSMPDVLQNSSWGTPGGSGCERPPGQSGCTPCEGTPTPIGRGKFFSLGLFFCLWEIYSSFIQTELASGIPAVEESKIEVTSVA